MEEFVLGDYIFSGKKIGKGAFSVIYKGTHKVTNKVFAIKEISYENLNKIKNTIVINKIWLVLSLIANTMGSSSISPR